MEALDARVDEVLGNTTAASTKYVYCRALIQLVGWLYANTDRDHREVLFTRQFLALESVNDDSISQWFTREPLESPMDLQVLTTKDCMRYLTSMEQRGIGGKSTFGNVRSALVYLYATTEHSRPHDFDRQMKRFFRGLHHTVARTAQRNNERLTEGKEPFSFSMYIEIAKAMLRLSKKKDVLGHSFLLICWNLMCRAKNATTIRHAHVS
ncbi:hypothetical protein ON010_g11835 [Phytophthora cinnamomi]|nr:hypothetical protein ON010_g11835 [Phytophthora cinnamomi]